MGVLLAIEGGEPLPSYVMRISRLCAARILLVLCVGIKLTNTI